VHGRNGSMVILNAMRTWLSTTTAALLVACGPQASSRGREPADAGPEPRVTVVGDTAFLELPIGRTADNGELRVTLDGVFEDSRCPSGVQCVWAGNASLRLTLATADESEVVVVNSTTTPHMAAFEGFVLGFRDLVPYPSSTEPLDRAAYVATIWVVDTR
jgi:hypothetical protein